jgi:Tol biopolymer transport system component
MTARPLTINLARLTAPLLVALASIVLISEPTAAQGATTRVSVDSAGNQSNGASDAAAISGDGRYVAFPSFASNLVPGDSNGTYDLFVHDRQTSETTRISMAADGSEANGSSQTGVLIHVRMSDDARYIAFNSLATNLVPEGIQGVMVHDRETGVTTLVSFNPQGRPIEGNAGICDISGDGRLVAFLAGTRLFLRDLASQSTSLVATGAGCGSLNRDGSVLAYLDEGEQIVVLDRASGSNETVSVNDSGEPANDVNDWPSISSDGRYVAFESLASNLHARDNNGIHDIYLHDRASKTTSLLSEDVTGAASGGSLPRLSGDRRHIVFNQTRGRGSLVVLDVETDSVETVSVNSSGEDANGAVPEIIPAPQDLSDDGRVVVFEAKATNLVDDDTNDESDIFVRDRDATTGGGQTGQSSPGSSLGSEEDSETSSLPIAVAGVGIAVVLALGAAILISRRRANR